jgi:hypothetical protein
MYLFYEQGQHQIGLSCLSVDVEVPRACCDAKTANFKSFQRGKVEASKKQASAPSKVIPLIRLIPYEDDPAKRDCLRRVQFMPLVVLKLNPKRRILTSEAL